MIKQGTNRTFVTLGLLLFAVGMMCALRWDLALNVALYHPTWMPAILMETHGFYTLYLPCLLWLCFLGARRVQEKASLWQGVVLFVSAGGVAAFLFWYGLHGLEKRAIAHAFAWNAGIWALLLLGGVALLLYSKGHLRVLEFAFRWSVVFMAASNTVINLMKLIWDRTRFDDMMAGGTTDAFTSWLRPFANGGNSFPSGHTAAACGIFVLVLLCDVLPAWGKKRTLVWSVCWIYIAFMAFCRIVIGRHFLSDTLMAMFVSAALFLALFKSKFYTAAVQKLQQ